MYLVTAQEMRDFDNTAIEDFGIKTLEAPKEGVQAPYFDERYHEKCRGVSSGAAGGRFQMNAQKKRFMS